MSCAAATAPTVSAASGTTGMLSFFHILAALIDQINTIGCDQCQYNNIGHHNLSPFFLSFPVHLASIITESRIPFRIQLPYEYYPYAFCTERFEYTF